MNCYKLQEITVSNFLSLDENPFDLDCIYNKFLIMIGSMHAYLSHNWYMIMWVSNNITGIQFQSSQDCFNLEVCY